MQWESWWHTNTWDEMRFTLVNQQRLDEIGKLYTYYNLYFRDELYELNVPVAQWERKIRTYDNAY